MSEATRDDWRRRVLAAMRAMEAGLDEELSLADIARAANRLAYGTKSVTDVALEAGFEAPGAFGRAFRAAYSLTPSAWRERQRDGKRPSGFAELLPPVKERSTMELTVTVKKLPPLRVACVRHVGPYAQCGEAWEKLCRLAGGLGLFGPQTRMFGAGHDDPAITPPEKLRSDACLTVPDSFAGTPELPVTVIGDAEYATAVVKGPYSLLAPAFAHLRGVWGPNSGREFAGAPSLGFYLNDPRTTPTEELLTEICVPLEPK